MQDLAAQIEQAVAAIRSHWTGEPRVGIILGTGLGSLAGQIHAEATIDYASIPHFPRSTAIGHAGQLVCGMLDGAAVVAMEGRFHAYEGYSYAPDHLSRPRDAGPGGGAADRLQRLRRHESALCPGRHHGHRGPHQPDERQSADRRERRSPWARVSPTCAAPYDRMLIDRALEIARRENFAAHKGVYVAVTGPNLETRAEYRFLRLIGADVVGMSTVPEVLVAVHAGMRVLGLSIVTDLCLPDALKPANIEEILATAAEAEPKLRKIVLGILAHEAGKAA